MNRTILHRIEVCTDMEIDDNIYGLRHEFGCIYVDSRHKFGSLDAPSQLPAGSCIKYTYHDCTDWVFQSTIIARF